MICGKKLSSRRLHFFLVAHCLILGDAHGRGGDAQGGEGGCTCILCIPPGYATGVKYGFFHLNPDPHLVYKSPDMNSVPHSLKSADLAETLV